MTDVPRQPPCRGCGNTDARVYTNDCRVCGNPTRLAPGGPVGRPAEPLPRAQHATARTAVVQSLQTGIPTTVLVALRCLVTGSERDIEDATMVGDLAVRHVPGEEWATLRTQYGDEIRVPMTHLVTYPEVST